jgi:3',5'-cyclic AMP phosphodiesterase CpdA
MLIAHLSDPHVLDLTGVSTARMVLNKRLTGWVNLKLNRGHTHRSSVVEAMMDDLRERRVDHVVITGDVSNLALEPEFEKALGFIQRMGYSPDEVSVIPGNHDLYTQGAQKSRRFARFFAPYMSCDLDVAPHDGHPSGRFPYVRLRGPVAILGVSTAVARLPLVASGVAGAKQIDTLRRMLEHPEVQRRVPVLLTHHPLTNPKSPLAVRMRGLTDAREILALFQEFPQALALHGHEHHREHEVLASTRGGQVHRIGATSASLVHRDRDRMAGYNLYKIIAGKGLVETTARVWDPVAKEFILGRVPLVA